MNNLDFTRNLVKGRIAETIFAQMFRETKNYTVLEFGYEKIVPELLQYNHDHENPVIETLRLAPDFAVINQLSGEVRLIEVKYRKTMNSKEILDTATKMHASWNPSHLFIASHQGFYFQEVGEIIKNEGHIKPLVSENFPEDLQSKYLKILNDFEPEEATT